MMTPPALLWSGLALVSLALYFLRAGAAAADATAAFILSPWQHNSAAVSIDRPQHAHDRLCCRGSYHALPVANLSSAASLRPRRRHPRALWLPWATVYQDNAAGAHRMSCCAQQSVAGDFGRARALRPRRPPRLRTRLGAGVSSGSAATSVGGGHGSKRAWGNKGADGSFGVDQTAPVEVERTLSVRAQIAQMLRPDLPWVREGGGASLV